MRGKDKLLEKIEGKPILRQIAAGAVATGCPVYATLPVDNPERLRSLSGLALTQIEVENADAGMSVSLRTGLSIIPRNAEGVMILLADMPDITMRDMQLLIDTFEESSQDQVVRAVDPEGKLGHPVIIPARLLSEMMQQQGDQGGAKLLASEDAITVELPDQHATLDLDTPEDWIAWRHANPLRN